MSKSFSLAAFALAVTLAGPIEVPASAAEISSVARAPLLLMANEAEAHDGQRVRARAARAARVRPVRRPVVRPGVVRPGVVRPGVVGPSVRPRPPVVVVRPWRQRPHYGRIIAGVTLGVIVTAAVLGSPPPPPAPNLCWYWTSSYQNEGYWDYCV